VFVPSEKFTFSISVRLPPLELIEDIASRSVLYFARSRLTEFLVETGMVNSPAATRMPYKALPDPVPLGVCGSVTVPLKAFRVRVGRDPDARALLLDDTARVAYITLRLADALDRPLTAPGSAGLAQSVMGHFSGVDVLSAFAEKALETLRDGYSHNRTAISPDQHVAVVFVAWKGTHRELQPMRFGNYLKPFLAHGMRLVQQGLKLRGFLEIDAYVRDNAEADAPAKAPDEVFEVDVEYSYIPGFLLGSSEKPVASLPNMVLLNPDLCDPTEHQVLKKLMARSS
jgi:hypothetical protein